MHLLFDVEAIQDLFVLVVVQQLGNVTRVVIVVDVVVVTVAKGLDGLGDVRAGGRRKVDVALDEHFLLVYLKNRKSIFSKSQLDFLLILQADLADRKEKALCDLHVRTLTLIQVGYERGDEKRAHVVFQERVGDVLHVRAVPLRQPHDGVFVLVHNSLVLDVVGLGDVLEPVSEDLCDVVFFFDILHQGLHDEGWHADDAAFVLLLDVLHQRETVAERLDRIQALLSFRGPRVPPGRGLVKGR